MKHEIDLEQLSDHVVAADANDQERRTEVSLRPQTLGDFVGQRDLVGHLSIVLGSARARNQCADHLLFAGPPGLGKTSLASIVASEMGAGFRVTSGPVLSRPGDLAALLTDLQDGDVLFIDELHRLSRAVEEVLYPAMEDLRLDVIEIELANETETVPQRRGDETRPRGGAHQREVRQIKTNRSR